MSEEMRKKVIESLIEFVERTAKGEICTEEETKILPLIVHELYLFACEF